jgi:Terpene cyclase DEP1
MSKLGKAFVILVTVAFAALTLMALLDHGVMGIFQHQFSNLAGWQVWVDLAIALGLILVWLVPDARERQINPWPWVVLTMVAGSFGPLIYLMVRKPLTSN